MSSEHTEKSNRHSDLSHSRSVGDVRPVGSKSATDPVLIAAACRLQEQSHETHAVIRRIENAVDRLKSYPETGDDGGEDKPEPVTLWSRLDDAADRNVFALDRLREIATRLEELV